MEKLTESTGVNAPHASAQNDSISSAHKPLQVELIEKKKNIFEKANSYAALMISVVALLTAVWSAYETRVHDRLSMLPVPTWQEEGSLEAKVMGIDVTNQGLGPVTLDNLHIYLDGKAIDNWDPVVTALNEAYSNKDVTASFHWYDNITLGSNVRYQFFYLKPSVIQRDNVDVLRDLLNNRLFIITRACSVYGDCSYTCYLPDKYLNIDCVSYEKSLSKTNG